MSISDIAKAMKEHGRILMKEYTINTYDFMCRTAEKISFKVHINTLLPSSDLDEVVRKESVDSEDWMEECKITTLTYK